MPSHDYSFVNTPLLLLPSAFAFHLSALSRWMTAWLQSSRLLQPNLPIVVPNSLLWQQLPVFPDFKNKFSEPEAGRDFSGALCASSSECNTDRASEILDTRSGRAQIRQRSMVGCHPLKVQGTGSSLFSFIFSLKCLVIMCQLTHITMSRRTHPHAS